MGENVHAGHREKLRQKFLKNKNSLHDHELIELLLFFSIPRINTNEQAHYLLKKSGNSIKGLFNLTDGELLSIENLGPNTVLFIKVLKELMLRIKKEELNKPYQNKITKNNIADKLHANFIGETEEKMIMITCDNDCRHIATHVVATGTENSASISIKKILSNVIADNATYVFLAHNHPNGMLVATNEDIETTKIICKSLALLNVSVIEHYIVTETSVVGIIKEYSIFDC